MSSESRGTRRSESSRRRAVGVGRRLQLEALEQRNLLAGFLFTVTTEFDMTNSGDGVMSLREAVAAANAAETADTINFSSSLAGKSIKLPGGQITITDSVAIEGLGVGATTVEGQGTGRLFDITNTAGDVTLDGLTLTGGLLATSGQNGGGIRSASAGQLKLLNCVITGNSTTNGAGGGIFASGAVILTNSTVTSNSTRGANASGGGLAVQGALTIDSSTVALNFTNDSSAHGGGIHVAGPLSMTNSTVASNYTLASAALGGGVFAPQSSVSIVSCTIAGNHVDGSDSSGGGLYFQSANVLIRNSIVAGNSDTEDGNSPDLVHFNSFTLQTSLVGDNSGTSLTPAAVGSADANGNFIGTHATPIDPLLGNLADHGGPTPTRVLLAGSPALNHAGSPGALTTDQRGFPRVAVQKLDMGAVEMQPPRVVLGGTVTYVENASPLVLAASATVTDLDGLDFQGGKLYVRIKTNADSADRVSVQNQGTGPGQIGVSAATVTFGGSVIATLSGGAGSSALVVSFTTADATPEAVRAVVRAITFRTLGENPATLARTTTFVLKDSQGFSSDIATAAKTVNVTRVNDKPALQLGGTVFRGPGQAVIVVAAGAIVSDSDSPNFTTGRLKVRISAGASSSNVLGIAGGFTVDSSNNVKLGATIIGKRNANGGRGTTDLYVTFNANATVSVVQSLVRAITFTTVGPNPQERSIVFSVSDGDGGVSADQTKTVIDVA